MTKREECFEIFKAHPEATRERAISMAMSKAGVTKATAQTYYPAWRNEYMGNPTPKQIKVNKIIDVPVKSPIVEKKEFKNLGQEVPAAESKEIKWKEDVIKPVEDAKEIETVKKLIAADANIEGILEINRLIPVVMKGTHGSYHFGKDGVRVVVNETFISKGKMDEELETLEVWERCYGNGGTQEC